ncbi:fatty acid desaturase family protein [Bacillus daqingensis]|uniref:Fatty acid desaturase family protein n=1 Tax=Bacillus daqingensis TaxID=872396 RepID=A0ABV9NRK6_9BACI
MRELHSFGWYAKQLKEHLPKKAFRPDPGKLLGGAAYLLITAAAMLSIVLLSLPLAVNLLLSLIIGMSFAAMGFLGHEILHGTIVRSPFLRNTLGGLFFWPLCTGPRLWRKWHNMSHHVHTQHEEKDPDTWLTEAAVHRNPMLRFIYRLPLSVRAFFEFATQTVMFSLHSLRMFKTYVSEFKATSAPALWLQLILPWATWISLLFIAGVTNWIYMFLIPLLIANGIVMAYISTNHRLNPQVEINDPLANSLTVTVPKWVDVIHFHFSHHTEHHLFPAVNSKYYPLVKQKIKEYWPHLYHEMPMSKALLALWKTPRPYFDGDNLIDPSRNEVYGTLGNGLLESESAKPAKKHAQ